MEKTKKETKPTDQKSLFGDQGHVFNVLHTRSADIRDEIGRCRDVIEKKESTIVLLKSDLNETEKAIAIVAKQRDKVKPKAAEKKKTGPAPF